MNLDSHTSDSSLNKAEHIIISQDVLTAMDRLNVHKNDDNCGISSCHFLHAGPDLSIHVAFLFTGMVTNGTAPKVFGVSTLIPITYSLTAILKQTMSYYVNSYSSVFCTILDASKAFDVVRYCKLFRSLIKRGLPPCSQDSN
jgi:hypothetical protein